MIVESWKNEGNGTCQQDSKKDAIKRDLRRCNVWVRMSREACDEAQPKRQAIPSNTNKVRQTVLTLHHAIS